MKIFIDNTLAKMNGGGEVEIENEEAIRFELDNGKKFRVSFHGDGLKIQETGDGISGDITIRPVNSNVILIK